MNYLNLIWIIALFFTAFASLIYAGFPYDTVENRVAYTGNDSLDTLSNFSKSIHTNICSSINGMISLDGAIAQGCSWVHQGIQVASNTINYTIFHGNVSANCADNKRLLVTERTNFTNSGDFSCIIVKDDATLDMRIRNGQTGGDVAIDGWNPSDRTAQDLQLVITSTDCVVIINGTTRATISYSLGYEPDFVGFGAGVSDTTSCSANISSFVSYNGSIYNRSSLDGISPIILTSFNASSFKLDDVINFTANITDGVGLLSANITYNFSGSITYINFSASGLSANISNVTKLCSSSCIINFTAFATDTNNNVAQVSNLISVDDTIPPKLLNYSLSATSITDGSQINISVNATDNFKIDDINISVLSPDGIILNRSCENLNVPDYLCNITFFDGDETSVVGIWNLTKVLVSDTSNNLNITYPNITFEITSPGGSGGGSSGGGGGGGGGFGELPSPVIILGNLSLILKPPIIASTQIFFIFPKKYNRQYTRFAIDLVPNKELESCISSIFECSISNNVITAAYNYSNDSVFIGKVHGKITLIDKSKLAKTIDASVRFINLGYSIPLKSSIISNKLLIYRLERGIVTGIRIWFILAVISAVSMFVYLRWREKHG